MTPITPPDIPPDAPDDATLEGLLQRSRVLEDAPEAVIQRAIDLAAGSLGAVPALPAAAAPGLLRRLVAVLGFDSAGQTVAVAGVRSAGAATRQLLYSTEGRDVDLRVGPAPDGRHWQISGQVLGPDTVGRARLRCGEVAREVAWSEWSEFSFDDVPAGDCVLTLVTAEWELELPPLHLPPDA